MRRPDVSGEAVPTSAPTSDLDPERDVEEPRAVAETEAAEGDGAATEGGGEQALSSEEQNVIAQLKVRDAEVRAHEQAHLAAGGGHITSGPSYSYQQGPDGKRYAIGGEVGIDTSMDSGDPAGNLQKARAIIRAAMAPANPSGQDQSVAAAAQSMEADAQQALREERDAVSEAMTQQKTPGSRDVEREGAVEASSGQVGADASGINGARERLEERIAGFFAAPIATGLSRFA
ncbi:hypothetical protein CKO27_08975 [Thiocystis violacea]|nr:putative metalloprotease CJM1_0395 family protein [Thiocystis violacea]MBK1717770.1 hypothetical protein [Thiocystis violacea]